MVVDPETRRVWREGNEIRLSRKEFDLLHALISRAGEIVSRDLLMQEVWQTTFWTSAKTHRRPPRVAAPQAGRRPRRPTLITTLRGRGLRFEKTAPVGGRDHAVRRLDGVRPAAAIAAWRRRRPSEAAP